MNALAGDAHSLAIGDSLLAWNSGQCQSVTDHAGLELGVPIENVAINGTRLLGGEGAIPDQYWDDGWDVVYVDGGANDLNGRCFSGEGTLDRLVSEDGNSGAMPELVDRIRSDGAEVVVIDYYRVSDRAWYGFGDCVEIFDRLSIRYQTMAEQRQGVRFVDLGDVINPEDTPQAYAYDNLHPGPKGAQLAGAHVAQAMD